MEKLIKYVGILVGVFIIIVIGLYSISFITQESIDLGVYNINSVSGYDSELNSDPLNAKILRSSIKFDKDKKTNLVLTFAKDNSLRVCEGKVTTKKYYEYLDKPGSNVDLMNQDLESTCNYIINEGEIPTYNDIEAKKITEKEFEKLIGKLEIENPTFDVNIGGEHYEKSANYDTSSK